MNTRIGKIARLPKWLRDQVNQDLENGEDGETILKRLNETPACKEMLAKHFNGKPINKQNLSDWKQGGYQEWLRNQEARERVQAMAEQVQDLEENPNGFSLADQLSTVLTLQLMDMTRQLETVKDPVERWKQTKEILRELHRLRREDHHARQIRLAQEKWEAESMEKEKARRKEAKEAKKRKLLDTFQAHRNLPLMAQLLGGGDFGAKWAIWDMCVRQDLQMPAWWDPENPDFEIPPGRDAEETQSEQGAGSQAESSSVKAGQGEETPGSDVENEDGAEAVGGLQASPSGLPSPGEMAAHFTQMKKEAELSNGQG